MYIRRLFVVFGLLIAGLIAAAFIGYHYLTLSSEYRARNFAHYQATQQAIDITRSVAVFRHDSLDKVRALVLSARAEVGWCIEKLSLVERLLAGSVGGGDVVSACASGLETNRALLDQLDAIEKGLDADRFGSGSQSAFAQRLRVLDALEQMRHSSSVFQPLIDEVETILHRTVMLVTFGTGSAAWIVFAILMRQFVAHWRDEKRTKREFAALSSRLKLALESPGEGMGLFDRHWRLLLCNKAYAETVHPDPAFVRPGKHVADILKDAIARGHYPDVDSGGADDFIADSLRTLEFEEQGIVLLTAGGRYVRVRHRKTEFGDTIVTRADVTDYVMAERRQSHYVSRLQAANAEIARTALTDALTGLPNRRHFDQILNAKSEHEVGPIIRIDLDRFKSVNDVLGHAAGDHVLRHVAGILNERLAPDCFPARIGGDEFVVLCPADMQIQDAARIAERFLAEFLKPILFEGRLCQYGASFGIAAPDPDHDEPADMLRDADVALYSAKAGGRAQVALFDRAMKHEASRARLIADALPRALAQGDLVPYFQTQHDARTGAVVGVEVLVRWNHPRIGPVTPDQFLPVARQLGQEAAVDRAVFEAGLAAIARLDAVGCVLPSVSFNASTGRLLAPDFLSTLDAIDFPDPRRIAFEVLETVSVELHGAPLIYVLDALRERGFRIEIDDFGSDHASINGLFEIGPETVKLDRTLSGRAMTSERSMGTVRAIVGLAHSLDLSVVAEGVETEEHAEILRRIGCDVLQGFHFSRPMPEDALQVFLASTTMAGLDERAASPRAVAPHGPALEMRAAATRLRRLP
ncbi:putative bifunctional diguanylate cyclase/phosphodiesterase [Citreimonas salinaria]|uniref:Diguanylate cyclase (GGDEF) domain-containing protein n=1 Tax=Citreimonas salinaria TaxID=321339 RepID=A0A1H3K301_9RHOB|nr:GGDEF and EAL domain-containing protein [Citreimonas salinaria]SDY46566.1 diguanylate cyclase (GGDEF) domain-containing protein [Citreimonas salinaria]